MFRQFYPKLFCTTSILLGLFAFSHPAAAIETLVKGASPQVGGPRAPRGPVQTMGPLIVSDVIVDKTADNAVLARDAAIADARRVAFRKLAQRNMSPEDFKAYKIPDDKVIAGLVQDFEINSEQLSTTRYVGKFSVRFRDAVRNYIDVDMTKFLPAPETPVAVETAGATKTTTETEEVLTAEEAHAEIAALPASGVPEGIQQGPPRKMLILPYYEGINGKTVLWDDPNPWRDIWQREAPKSAVSGNSYLIPLGDISDVSAGSADAVWSGNYKAVEKLRQNYAADDVILSVANKSGPYLTLDMYFFRDGKLRGRQVLQPYVGDKDDLSAYRQGMEEAVAFLQKRPMGLNETPVAGQKKSVEDISRDLLGKTADTAAAPNGNIPQLAVPMVVPGGMTQAPPPRFNTDAATTTTITSTSTTTTTTTAPMPVAQQAARGGPTELNAAMSFTNYATWLDLQKRVSSVSPPVALDIRSLSKNGASFTIRYGGDVNALQSALAARGVMLQRPAVEFDPTVIGQGAARPVYGVQLVN